MVTEPTINEIRQVVELARAFIDTEDSNVAIDEPISDGERDVVLKVDAWAEALENLSAQDEAMLALKVLAKHDTKFFVERVLTVSTAHVMAGTAERLTNDDIPNLIVYEKGEYGWFVWVPGLKNLLEMNTPSDLFALMQYAESLCCQWLCLDPDALVIPDFPTWEW